MEQIFKKLYADAADAKDERDANGLRSDSVFFPSITN